MPVTEPKLLDTDEPSLTARLLDLAKRLVLASQTYSLLSFRSITNIFSAPQYISDLFDQMNTIGVGSLPIAMVSGLFIGAVTVLQTAAQFARYGETALTGEVVAIGLVRELGPTITGLLVAGRNSSGMASELGSMLVTEQVDAMRAMGTDPSRKLVTPRVLATVLVLPLLVALADFVGLVGGVVVAYSTQHIGAVEFWTRAVNGLDFSDLMQGLVKPVAFGFILATIGCYYGLTVRGGTQGVGRATTQAVVASSIMILVADFFLDKILLFLAGHVL
ncbi:MAG: ABC transporter permease [Candidatus Acidiferrales bacterium]|jgi:phospholipid/cholesterol/gamma-HCH transport system permease protein